MLFDRIFCFMVQRSPEVRVLLEVTVGNMVLGQLSSSQSLCADAAPFFASLSDDIET